MKKICSTRYEWALTLVSKCITQYFGDKAAPEIKVDSRGWPYLWYDLYVKENENNFTNIDNFASGSFEMLHVLAEMSDEEINVILQLARAAKNS